MRRHTIAFFCIIFLMIAPPVHGKDMSTSIDEQQFPVHLAILDASNNTGDPSLDWMSKGALELITYSLSYMHDIVLVPIENDITSGHIPVMGDLEAFEIRNGLSVSIEGTPSEPTLIIRTQVLTTGEELLSLSISGTQGYILSRLPETASRIASSLGYLPGEHELRWAQVPATSSPLAWRHYTEALYGPGNNTQTKLEAALRADPSFSEAIARLAMLHLEKGKREQAVSEASRALKIKPFLHTALYSMTKYFYMKGDGEKAQMYLSRLMEINPRNRFIYNSRNIDSSRNFPVRSDYVLFGTEAAIADLHSPVYFDGAFRYLSTYKSYSQELKSGLGSPNTAIRLISMKWSRIAGLRSGEDSMWKLLESDNFILRALALDMFSNAGERSGCNSAIKGMSSIGRLFKDFPDNEKTESLRNSFLSETARAVGARCDAASERPLRKLLGSKDRATRLVGACLLGQIGSGDEMDGILEAINTQDLLMLASDSLIRAASEEDIGRIYGIIETAPSSYIPLATIASFDSRAASAAMSRAIASPDISIRLSAVHALGHSHFPEAFDLLEKALSDPNPDVRVGSALSLKKLQKTSRAIGKLISMLSGGGSESGAALEALASSGERTAVLSVINAAGNQVIPSLNRAEAILTLKGATPDDIRPLLSHEEGAVRAAALRRLAEMKDSDNRKYLLEALSDSAREMRIAALEIISDINTSLMAEEARGMINGVGIDLSATSTDAFSHAPVDDMDKLQRALADNDAGVRKAAARALGTTQRAEVIPALALALLDRDRAVRIEAAGALGKVWGRESDMALQTVQDDPDPEVRMAALISRAQLGERKLIDALATDAANNGLYISALTSAARILEDSALSIYLLDALTMPGDDMRPAIYNALVAINAPDDIYRHLAATDDPRAFQAMRMNGNFMHGDLSILTEEPDDYARGTGYYLMALKARETEDIAEMQRLAEKAYKYAKGSGRWGFTVASLLINAEAQLKLNDPDAAMRTLRKADKWLNRSSLQERKELYGDLEMPARIPLMLGLAYQSKGKMDEAASYYRTALSRAELNSLLHVSADEHESSVIPEALDALKSTETVKESSVPAKAGINNIPRM